MLRTIRQLCLLPSAFCLFVVLATLNSAGYRYGASDQALYIPAVLRHLDPALFPQDRVLISAHARLMVVDEILAGVVRLTRVSIQHLFFALYVTSLLLLVAGASRIGAHLYRTRWAVVALGAALTLRHAIAKTGANSLEGYFHPRQLAFALGVLAVAAFLERRERIAAALVLSAGLVHPTTAFWFMVWLGVAAWLARPEWRKALAAVRAGARRRGRARLVARAARGAPHADGRGLARGHRRPGLPLSARLAGGRLGHQPDRRPGDCLLLARAGARAASPWPAKRRSWPARWPWRSSSSPGCRSAPPTSRSPSSCRSRACSG